LRHLRAREGDFVETHEGLIFDVKGLVHPPDRVVAYLRYIEDPLGDRKRGEKRYLKVYSLSEREKTLRSRYPHYLFYDPIFGENLEGVPHRFVSNLYQPAKKVSEFLHNMNLDRVQDQSIKFVQLIHDSTGVQLGKLGLSGSVLVDLHTGESDIDLVVYGRKNCISVYESLRQVMQAGNGAVCSYSVNDLERLYEFRSKDTRMPLKDFLRIERRKFSQGKFNGRDFFVRFILDWDEVDERYGDRLYRASGYAKIEAKVEEDADSILTPCRYVISDAQVVEGTKVPPPEEIVSLRGRFCEQAQEGERIVAQGKVEQVIEKDGREYFRLILGARPSDFMISR